jgi:hypothetical protein
MLQCMGSDIIFWVNPRFHSVHSLLAILSKAMYARSRFDVGTGVQVQALCCDDNSSQMRKFSISSGQIMLRVIPRISRISEWQSYNHGIVKHISANRYVAASQISTDVSAAYNTWLHPVHSWINQHAAITHGQSLQIILGPFRQDVHHVPGRARKHAV